MASVTGYPAEGYGIALATDPVLFGAVYDGVTDSTNALNAAIASAATSSGRVLLQTGTLYCAGTVLWKDKVVIEGQGPLSILTLNGATGLDGTGVTSALVQNCTLQCGANCTFLVKAGNKCAVKHATLLSPSTGSVTRSGVLALGTGVQCDDLDITWTNGNTSGVNPIIGFAIIGQYTGSDRMVARNIRIISDNTMAGIGIGVNSSTGFNSTVTDCIVTDCVIRNTIGDAILSGNPHNTHAGHIVAHNIVDGTSWPTAPAGYSATAIEMHGADIVVTDNTVNNAGSTAIYADGNGIVVGGNNCRVYGTDANQDFAGGIVVTSPASSVVNNVCLDGGSVANTHVAGLIVRSDYAGSPTIRCTVLGNRFGDSRVGAARTQGYGIRIYNSQDMTDSNTFDGNDCTNNVSGAISDNGGPGGNPNGTGSTTSVFVHNKGFNPVGVNIRGGQPAMVTSGTVVVNTYSHPVNVYLSAGTGAPSNPTKVNAVSTGIILGCFHLEPGDSIQPNGYAGTTPAWLWVGE